MQKFILRLVRDSYAFGRTSFYFDGFFGCAIVNL